MFDKILFINKKSKFLRIFACILVNLGHFQLETVMGLLEEYGGTWTF